MRRLQAFKFELRPNGGQQRQMRRFAGSCRFVYNKALAWQIAAYAEDRTVTFNYTTLANFLPTWKREMPWLRQSASQTLQQSLKNLEFAYQNFFERRARFPAMPHSSVGISVVHGGEDVNRGLLLKEGKCQSPDLQMSTCR